MDKTEFSGVMEISRNRIGTMCIYNRWIWWYMNYISIKAGVGMYKKVQRDRPRLLSQSRWQTTRAWTRLLVERCGAVVRHWTSSGGCSAGLTYGADRGRARAVADDLAYFRSERLKEDTVAFYLGKAGDWHVLRGSWLWPCLSLGPPPGISWGEVDAERRSSHFLSPRSFRKGDEHPF